LTGPSRVSCNAAYSAPCARINAQWYAQSIAANATTIAQINNGVYNYATGFYPFVFDNTSLCVAHGANPSLVGLFMEEIFDLKGLEFSNVTALHDRFVQAASKGGDWVRYLWADGGQVNSKLSFVTALGDDGHYIGVGYQDEQLPPDVPCSDQTDGWCSMTNVQSLVGKAQFRLYEADSYDSFDAVLFELSFAADYTIPEGFYTFMYSFDESLVSHARLHDDFGKSLSTIYEWYGLGTPEEGRALHEQFVAAANGRNQGWVMYPWRNSLDEEPYTKIAYIVKIVFRGHSYYLGAGFTHNMGPKAAGPLNAVCSDKTNLPCSFVTTSQLSSHTLAHVIASDTSVNETFAAVTSDRRFRRGNFYAYIYNYKGTCVAHGSTASNVGLTLSQVYEKYNIPLNATKLHETFKAAADGGGGWVQYDWLIPGVRNSDFEKIAYIFKMYIDGVEYYGGVGFEDRRHDVQTMAAVGRRKNGDAIRCTRKYNLDCSEVNTQSILGEALADLTLESSSAKVTLGTQSRSTAVTETLRHITRGSQSQYQVNDFFVMVFSTDGLSFDGSTTCGSGESGCCIAHGQDPSKVGLSWQQYLDADSITSIRGFDIHEQMVTQSNSAGGGVTEFVWAGDGQVSQTKRAWVGHFRNEGRDFYVVSDYFKTDLPPTCDQCLEDMECTADAQEFCVAKPPPSLARQTWFILTMSAVSLVCLAALLMSLVCWRKRKASKQKSRKAIDDMETRMKAMATQMEHQMQGMFEVVYAQTATDPHKYAHRFGIVGAPIPDKRETTLWFWEEDEAHMDKHKSSEIISGTKWVKYHDDSSNQIERAFQMWQEGTGYALFSIDLTNKIVKVNNAHTGARYEVDFESLTQRNENSDHKRNVYRQVADDSSSVEGGSSFAGLPPLPDDIDFSDDGEDLLPTSVGQVIQVSKVHPSKAWMFGNVLYDPILSDALKNDASVPTPGLNSMIASAIHDRPTSGWFPCALAKQADVKVMHKLLSALGGEGMNTLSPPDTWEADTEGIVQVAKGTDEYKEVAAYFQHALYGQRKLFQVTGVQRVQNLTLWQTYAVKKQTMKTRDLQHPNHLCNNKDLSATERRWLFHGSTSDIVPKIVKQGFNRAFAGRNAVAYGKGTYFARDASYSSHEAYSTKDAKGIQRMFLARVAVGDWSKGNHGQLTPDPKPHNALELFDTTVDNVRNPSIFVVYHDAQAYPEYIVSFRSVKVGV